MDGVGSETCPLPQDPTLAAVSVALEEAGAWGLVVDDRWRVVYLTDDIRLSNGAQEELAAVPLDLPYFSPEALEVMLAWSGGVFALEAYRRMLEAVLPWVLEDTPGGAGALRQAVDPRLRDVVDAGVAGEGPPALTYRVPGSYSAHGVPIDVLMTGVRLRDAQGRLVGTMFTNKPAAPMAVLGAIAAAGDLRHFARMQQLSRPARQPAAILFADLERSSALARRLSTASYFALGRRLVRAADQCVVDAGGMVGRHVGDGVVSFFLARHAGSESAAARACIAAMRALRADLADVAVRSQLAPEDVVLRFGLHWGSTLHIGHIATAARAEVNALGDEVNETARIEACAQGGRALASKALIERLDPADAAALGLDPDHLSYTVLAELGTATEKARRDAPAVAVCEI